MKSLRVLYHLARADFLERTRRYSFLIMLGLVLLLGVSVARGQLVLVIGSHYRGAMSSAWVGSLMAIMVNVFLGLFGFYLVKGSIQRDYETGVGQIMATTPLKRPQYTLGKWLSNFSILALMAVVLIAVAAAMQWLDGEEGVIDFRALLAPFFFLVFPFMALIAALAVLFETIETLRHGLGNMVYFLLYSTVILMFSLLVLLGASPTLDLVGVGIMDQSLVEAAKRLYPDVTHDFNITGNVPELQTFPWAGIAWTWGFALSRLVLTLATIGIATLAAVFFDRFNPSRQPRGTKPRAEAPALESVALQAVRVTHVRLSPLADTERRFRFAALCLGELRLALKGQPWWWYAIALGLVIGQLFAPLAAARTLLVVAWTWPILILSGLGCREARFRTHQIVFSAPHPFLSQLPAAWLTAFAVLSLMGSGALLRFLVVGEMRSALGWLIAVLFIPSLAVACGVLTGSNKVFEVIFMLWMYLITQKMSSLDFMGMTPEAPLRIHALLALVLLAVTVVARRRQLTGRLL